MERMFRGYREERGCCSVNGRTDESEAENAGYCSESGEDAARQEEAAREAFEERAAVLEFDAGLSREEAERLAREMTGYHGW